MLPIYFQLDGHAPGFLLLPVARHARVHHHDPTWNGDSPEAGTHPKSLFPKSLYDIIAFHTGHQVNLDKSLLSRETTGLIMHLALFCSTDTWILWKWHVHTWLSREGKLWDYCWLQVRVQDVFCFGLLFLPLLHHHDSSAQQQGPTGRHSERVSFCVFRSVLIRLAHFHANPRLILRKLTPGLAL